MRPRRGQSRLDDWHHFSKVVAPDVILIAAFVAAVLAGMGVLEQASPIVLGAPFTLAAFLYGLRER